MKTAQVSCNAAARGRGACQTNMHAWVPDPDAYNPYALHINAHLASYIDDGDAFYEDNVPSQSPLVAYDLFAAEQRRNPNHPWIPHMTCSNTFPLNWFKPGMPMIGIWLLPMLLSTVGALILDVLLLVLLVLALLTRPMSTCSLPRFLLTCHQLEMICYSARSMPLFSRLSLTCCNLLLLMPQGEIWYLLQLQLLLLPPDPASAQHNCNPLLILLLQTKFWSYTLPPWFPYCQHDSPTPCQWWKSSRYHQPVCTEPSD